MKRNFFKCLCGICLLTVVPFVSCSSNEAVVGGKKTSLAKIDSTKWNYNEKTDVYWQVGIVYCEKPNAPQYQTLGVYVPGVYMNGIKNEDGTYTCKINKKSTSRSGYTAKNAPIVFPVNTPGYFAMPAPTGYDDSITTYTDAGFLYVNAGCRGRTDGAPAGVTDLKAALRYIRYSKEVIPGSTDRIVAFGMSGGGAQTAVLGASGDSLLYVPYLDEIGAIENESDAICGAMCWCPITNLDFADEAYEWNMGVTRTGLTQELQTLSNELALVFPEYLNLLGLTDESGIPLFLMNSDTGIFQAGTYYDYLVAVIESSLNDFLAVTEFPYTIPTQQGLGPQNLPIFEGTQLPPPINYAAIDGITRFKTTEGVTLSGTYNTVQDYISALNSKFTWVTYDSQSNTATISSIADFVKALKPATKPIGAFDALDASQGENILFGYNGIGAHFDPILGDLVSDIPEYATAFQTDLNKEDALGKKVAYRMNTYNPMYYINPYYQGYGTSEVAKYWRIRTGIDQSDTALTTEVDLSLALQAYGAEVDFATIWGKAHVEAELVGTPTGNFIDWVTFCFK